jgi:hypothetical protein
MVFEGQMGSVPVEKGMVALIRPCLSEDDFDGTEVE